MVSFAYGHELQDLSETETIFCQRIFSRCRTVVQTLTQFLLDEVHWTTDVKILIVGVGLWLVWYTYQAKQWRTTRTQGFPKVSTNWKLNSVAVAPTRETPRLGPSTDTLPDLGWASATDVMPNLAGRCNDASKHGSLPTMPFHARVLGSESWDYIFSPCP